MSIVAFSVSHASLAPAFSRRGARPARRARRAPACPPPRGFAFENEELSGAEEDVRTDLAVGIGGHARTGGEDIMDEARVVDPYGLIQNVMSSPAHTLTPGLELDDPVVRTSLERHHGLPVVSADTGQVVGVLSRSDVRRLGEANTSAYTVGEAMSAPPICVRPRAHIAEAAGVMLQHKVHRLPVVDDRSVPVGVATRQDVFEPLVATRDDVLADQQTRRYERPYASKEEEEDDDDDESSESVSITAASDDDDRSSGVSMASGGEKKHRASPLPRKNASKKKNVTAATRSRRGETVHASARVPPRRAADSSALLPFPSALAHRRVR